MKNLKRLLAVLVVVAIVATTAIVPVFAAEALSDDAIICKDLGVLQGADGGVTVAYTKTQPDRVQAALLFLRLKGLGDTAETYAATNNFSDVSKHWGKNITGYLYDNPSLGWVGDSGKFNPNDKITVQQYYKVMLVALGYVESADFQYSSVMSFAAKKGLTALSDVGATKIISIDQLATATVETLKAKLKDGTKTLVEKLVADKVIDAKKAEDAGVYVAPVVVPVPVTYDVKSVTAKTNGRVDIALNTAATKVDASQITIEGLAITSSTLSADGKTIVVVTAAQTPGTLYKMTINKTAYEFVGLVKDTTKLAITAVAPTTNTTVDVTFDNSDFDPASATNVANYVINDLTVTAASVSGKVVTLTTSAQTAGKLYTLTTSNVADLSGNVMDKKESKFGGRPTDTTKPAVKSVDCKDGNTLTITYTEVEKLSDTAINVANYVINNDLTVTSATFKKDTNKLGLEPVVILKTSNQVAGKLYKLTIKNVADVAGNVMADKDINFGGTPLDTGKIGITSATATTNTKVEVVLDDDVDATTIVPANFTINDLTVTAAALDTDSTTKVILTTSAQTAGKLYTLTIANIKDDTGNGVNTDLDDKKFGGIAADTDKPTISSVTAASQYSITVEFSEKVDKTSATTLSNYSITDLGYPTSASLNSNGTTLTLGTTKQSAKTYTLTVNNVKDLSGNAIAASSTKVFSGIGDAIGKVKLDSAYALDKYTFKLIFNQALDKTSAENEANYTIKSTVNSATNIGVIAGATVAATDVTAIAKLGGDNSNEVTVTFSSAFYMNTSEIYTVAVAGVTGKYGAILDTDADEQPFAGINSDKAKISIDSINVVDNRNIEVIYNNDIAGTPVAAKFVLFTKDDLSDTPGLAAATASISGKKVKLGFSTNLTQNIVYYLDVATGHGVTDVSGLFGSKVSIDAAAGVEEAVFATGAVVAPSLKVDAAVMTDVNTLEVYFNQNVTNAGFDPTTDVVIKNAAGDTIVSGSEFKNKVFKDNKLTLSFINEGTAISAGSVYTVVFSANQAKIQYANNTAITLALKADGVTAVAAADQKADFAAVATENAAPYIVSAQAVASDKVLITFSEGLATSPEASIDVVYGSSNTSVGAMVYYGTAFAAGNKTIVLQLSSGTFAAGTTYTLYIKNADTTMDVAGIVYLKKDKADGGAFENSVVFSGIQ